MARNAWDRDAGRTQGRIEPTEWAAPSGQWAFCLGRGERGHFEPLKVGDFVRVAQNGTLTGRMLNARARLVPPTTPLPVGLSWAFEAKLAGTVFYAATLDEPRTLADLAMATDGAPSGEVSFELRLVGPPGQHEVELPAVYLDALAFSTPTARVVIGNRRPEPGSTSATSQIQFDLYDVGATPTGIDVAATTVIVNGLLAFDGTSFQPGFGGPESDVAPAVPSAYAARFVVDPVSAFASESVVSVRVITRAIGSTETIDVTYTFTMADSEPPIVLGAQASSHDRVRVQFSESMRMLGDDAVEDALTASNYVLTRRAGEISVAVAVVGVERISDREVELRTNWELSPGRTYDLVVTNAQDLHGNAVAAPTNTAVISGYRCAVPEGRRFLMTDLVPDMNLDEDSTGDLATFLAIIQEMVDMAMCRIDEFTSIIDPNTAPIRFVEAMLDDLGNPFMFELSDVDKRRLAQVLWSIYAQKGTRAGIINAIRFFLGIEVQVFAPGRGGDLGLGEVEIGETWILGSGDPDTWIDLEIISPVFLTDEQLDRMFAIADYMRAAWERIRRVVQPDPPPEVVDHLELGLSELGVSWILHGQADPLVPPVFVSATPVPDTGGQTTIAVNDATPDAVVRTDGVDRVTYYDSPMQLRADVPAHAAGTVSVEIVQSSGSSGVQAAALTYTLTAADPVTFGPTLYWEQRPGADVNNYSKTDTDGAGPDVAARWEDRGAAGLHWNQAYLVNQPDVAESVNGAPMIQFDSVSVPPKALTNTATLDDFGDANDVNVSFLLKLPASFSAWNAMPYANALIIADVSGWFIVMFGEEAGVKYVGVGAYDGSWKYARAPVTEDTIVQVNVRHMGGQLMIAVNDVPAVDPAVTPFKKSVACGPILGTGYQFSTAPGGIGSASTWKGLSIFARDTLADGRFADLRAWWRYLYNLDTTVLPP